MTTTDAAAEPITAAPAATYPKVHRAGRVVMIAALAGLAGQLLFYGVALGLNLALWIALVVAAGWRLRRPGARPALRDAWLAPAAVAFAAFAAVRADTTILIVDTLAAIALATAALASFGGRTVIARPFTGVVRLAVAAATWIVTGVAPVLHAARRQMPGAGRLRRRLAPAAPVLRGLLIALPILVVFVALFSAADAVFAQRIADVTGFDLDLGSVPGRVLLAGSLAWLVAGALGMVASPASLAPERTAAPDARVRIGPTEALTVLVAIDLLFVAFVALQAAYLFGGLDTLQASGLTYAEYARRGFFELVAVVLLAGALVIGTDRLVASRSRPVVVAAVALTVLTAVVLASAGLRLRLYQEAYGWTELRLYVVATMAVLAIGLATLIWALARDRVRWVAHVLVVAGLVVALGLNVLGPARFITDQNVERFLRPELVPPSGYAGLDVSYAVSLGDDAIPALVRALSELDGLEAHHLAGELRIRLAQLRADGALTAWQAWNLGRAEARDALAEARRRGLLD